MTGELGVLVDLCAALALGEEAGLRAAVRRAAREADPLQVEEALLQSHLALGFPAALRALELWREERAAPALSDGGPEGDEEHAETARARSGAERCRRVYGRAYPALRRNVRALHPALDRWMVREGYGKVYGREGLDLPRRELCMVALLLPGGWEAQLASHLYGALNVGVTPGLLRTVVERVLAGTSQPPRWSGRARELLERAVGREAGETGRPGGSSSERLNGEE